MINPITMSIIRNAKDGDTIREISVKTGFAYSAVYGWIKKLDDFGVLNLEDKGNKTVISVNKELIYNKFMELLSALETAERDRNFWKLMRSGKYNARCVKGTAAVVWTQGGYITGDFFDKIYHIEVLEKDSDNFKEQLKKHMIEFGREGEIPGSARPFICVNVTKKMIIEKKNSLPVMPLRELISWCRKLHLEPVLEQLDLMYNMGLKERYSEVYTNV
ncbi:MAG: helix-turn-helix domain-containing protein [Candidatus Aenigmarchaeota archaeon]|nr:helix-turn-helix domain-containing protein [Candidatus Aenigmarchaeota archaeon]